MNNLLHLVLFKSLNVKVVIVPIVVIAAIGILLVSRQLGSGFVITANGNMTIFLATRTISFGNISSVAIMQHVMIKILLIFFIMDFIVIMMLMNVVLLMIFLALLFVYAQIIVQVELLV